MPAGHIVIKTKYKIEDSEKAVQSRLLILGVGSRLLEYLDVSICSKYELMGSSLLMKSSINCRGFARISFESRSV